MTQTPTKSATAAPTLLDKVLKGPRLLPPRIILLGEEKIGKSTFASQFPDPIFVTVDGETGVDEIDTHQFPAASKLDEVMANLRSLYKDEHNYKTVAVDSTSALEPIIWDATCKRIGCQSIEDPGYGKGYVEALTEWRLLLKALEALRKDKGMTTILIGHVQIRQINDPVLDPYDAYVWTVNAKAGAMMQQWADSILYACRKVTVIQKETGFNKRTGKARVASDERMVLTRGHPSRPGGGRGVYGRLPMALPLDYAAFAEAVAAERNGTVAAGKTKSND